MTLPPSSPPPFDEMQRAVDIVGTSPHPTNKISATLFGHDPDGTPYSLSRTNCWPQAITDYFGMDIDIGDSSGTIHAETAAIFAAPYTMGAALCVTDPFCPNCAKNIAEAGIKTIYIDHKGFEKDFAARRSGDFESMSMRICERAGISVYEMRRKEQTVAPIYVAPRNYKPHEDRPVTVEQLMAADEGQFHILMQQKRHEHAGMRMACAIARDRHKRYFALTALAHPAVGYALDTDIGDLEKTEGKYSFIMEPVNRLLMNAARYGLKLGDGMIYSAHVPTSREQVNLVGAGVTSIVLGDAGKARDEASLFAMKQLRDAGVMEYRPIRMMA